MWVLLIFHILHIYCLNISLYWKKKFWRSKHLQVFYTPSEFSIQDRWGFDSISNGPFVLSI